MYLYTLGIALRSDIFLHQSLVSYLSPYFPRVQARLWYSLFWLFWSLYLLVIISNENHVLFIIWFLGFFQISIQICLLIFGHLCSELRPGNVTIGFFAKKKKIYIYIYILYTNFRPNWRQESLCHGILMFSTPRSPSKLWAFLRIDEEFSQGISDNQTLGEGFLDLADVSWKCFCSFSPSLL